MPYHLTKRRKKKIKLSINRDIAMLLTIAEQKGFFHDHELNFEYIDTPYAYLSMQMLMNGEADIATMVEVNFAYLGFMKPKTPIKSFLSVEQRTADNFIIRKANASPHALIGCTVGFTPRSTSHSALSKFLALHDIEKRQIQMKPYSPQALPNALIRGEVDAISAWQPHIYHTLVALEELDIPHTYFENDGFYVGEVVLAAQKQFMVKYPEHIKNMLCALKQAEQFLQENPQVGLSILAEKMKISGKNKEEVFKQMMPSLQPICENYMGNIDIIADWIRENDTEFMGKDYPNYMDYIDNSYFLDVFTEK